eukprot:scaffold175_cov414-Prasinococcus_capsulatus_cf.AAC.18
MPPTTLLSKYVQLQPGAGARESDVACRFPQLQIVVNGFESEVRNFAIEEGVVNDLTIVVGLSKGNVVGVEYQSQSCYSALEDRPCAVGSIDVDGFCDEFENCVIPYDTCLEEQYSAESHRWLQFPTSDGDTQTLEGADCDMSFIIAWSGTDKNSVPMKTGSQISGINKWSVGSLAGSVADFVSETAN